MAPFRRASIAIEEMPITAVVAQAPTGAEALGNGPLVITATDGLMAIGPMVSSHRRIQGRISLCPCTNAEGAVFMSLQLDIEHPERMLHVAASFAIEVEQVAEMLARLAHPVELARFEATS